MNEFQVTMPENKELPLGEALSIPNDRFDVLNEHLTKSLVSSENATEAMHKATSIVENINELAFLCFCLGANVQRSRNPLSQLVNALFSDKE